MNIKFAYPLRWRAPSPLVENMDAQNEPTEESLSVAVFGKRVPEGPRRIYCDSERPTRTLKVVCTRICVSRIHKNFRAANFDSTMTTSTVLCQFQQYDDNVVRDSRHGASRGYFPFPSLCRHCQCCDRLTSAKTQWNKHDKYLLAYWYWRISGPDLTGINVRGGGTGGQWVRLCFQK